MFGAGDHSQRKSELEARFGDQVEMILAANPDLLSKAAEERSAPVVNHVSPEAQQLEYLLKKKGVVEGTVQQPAHPPPVQAQPPTPTQSQPTGYQLPSANSAPTLPSYALTSTPASQPKAEPVTTQSPQPSPQPPPAISQAPAPVQQQSSASMQDQIMALMAANNATASAPAPSAPAAHMPMHTMSLADSNNIMQQLLARKGLTEAEIYGDAPAANANGFDGSQAAQTQARSEYLRMKQSIGASFGGNPAMSGVGHISTAGIGQELTQLEGIVGKIRSRCTRIEAENEELHKQMAGLQGSLKEKESLCRRLQGDNASLKEQLKFAMEQNLKYQARAEAPAEKS